MAGSDFGCCDNGKRRKEFSCKPETGAGDAVLFWAVTMLSSGLVK